MKALIALLALAPAAAYAASPSVIEVSGAWSRPAVQGSAAAGYLTLTNAGKAADALVAAKSPLAAEASVHRSTMSGGMAMMQAEPRVPVPAAGSVAFAPGGYHIMFMGLKRTLKVGDRLPATLKFASGVEVKTEFQVRVSPPPHGH